MDGFDGGGYTDFGFVFYWCNSDCDLRRCLKNTDKFCSDTKNLKLNKTKRDATKKL